MKMYIHVYEDELGCMTLTCCRVIPYFLKLSLDGAKFCSCIDKNKRWVPALFCFRPIGHHTHRARSN